MTARLVQSLEIAPDTRHFVFEIQERDDFDYQPGQFVSLLHEIDGKSITRAYSLAGLPDGNRVELCLNLVDDGKLSPHLFAMQPGDSIDLKGPYGTFVFREPRPTVMVATGTGVAPFRGMLSRRLPQDETHPYTLIFGVREEAKLLYRNDFERLARTHPNFRFLPTLTRPSESWTGRTGRVQSHLFELLGDRREVDVYICGLKAMVDDVRAKLKELGFERKQIIFEKYD
ncbi:MAG TPA: oxidoreductase [Solibacterales bacterium]|nr:oxidoreductase [Bryobacterales bacterium]